MRKIKLLTTARYDHSHSFHRVVIMVCVQVAEDKARYDREMEAYVPPSNEELEAMAHQKEQAREEP